MRVLRNSCVVAFVLVTMATGCSGHTTAPASGEHISRFDVTMVLERDGALQVRESISYDFGNARRHGIFRDIPRRETYLARPGFDRLYRIDDVSVSADQETSAKTKRSTSGPYLHLRIGDPNKTVTGEHRYVISYTVRDAPGTFAGHDELFWDAVGNQWPVPINRATVAVSVPAGITKVGCTAGPAGSRLGCDRSSSDGRHAEFAQANLAREAGVTVAVAMPKGTIQPPPEPILDKRWTLGEGFARRTNTLIPAGLIALAGVGLMLVLAWTGRDRRFKGSAVDAAMGNVTGDEGPMPLFAKHEEPVEFVPPAGVRPGQIGVLIDEDASVLDVTATIVDLAVRRYLKITQLPPEGSSPSAQDYELTKLAEPAQGLAALLPYESELLNALFQTGMS